ncbi:MAG: hypothetical protein WCV81_05475 [Microgenomates group bacterium]|jgi:hypothetical protein
MEINKRKGILIAGGVGLGIATLASGCVQVTDSFNTSNFSAEINNDNSIRTTNVNSNNLRIDGGTPCPCETPVAGVSKADADALTEARRSFTAVIGNEKFTVTPRPTEPVATATAIATVKKADSTPTPTATQEACPQGEWKVIDLNGKPILGLFGVPTRVTGGVDLANHEPFTSSLKDLGQDINPLQNVLADPGSMLIDRDLIKKTESEEALKDWDQRVADGKAEYIWGDTKGGHKVNFYDFQSKDDPRLTLNKETGDVEFRLVLPKHVLVRIDAEEADISLKSKERNIRMILCQSGANRGVDFGHQTVFIRTSYEDEVTMILKNPTVPGTQVQIFGQEVKSATAFASIKAFLQGVEVKQARPDYPRYFVHTLNMNDYSFGSAESPKPNVSFKGLVSNYLKNNK